MNCFLKVGMLEQCFINDEFTINYVFINASKLQLL